MTIVKVEPVYKFVRFYLPEGKYDKIHKVWIENSVGVNITNRIKKATFMSCDLMLEQLTDYSIKVLGDGTYLPFFFTESGFDISAARNYKHPIDIEFDDYIDFGNYLNDFEDVPRLCVTGQGDWPENVPESFDKVYEKRTFVKTLLDTSGLYHEHKIKNCDLEDAFKIIQLRLMYPTLDKMPKEIKCTLKDGSRVDYYPGIDNVVKVHYTGSVLVALLQFPITLRFSNGKNGVVFKNL
jgi:hypothetical protein